jgi:hypothetical protein
MHVIDFLLIYIIKSFQFTPISITPVRPGTHPRRKSRATCIVVSASELEHSGQILQQDTRHLSMYFQLNKYYSLHKHMFFHL